MREDVQSAMLEILKRIQADVSALKSDMSNVRGRLEKVEGRLVQVEELAKRQRRDSAAMLVMMRGTVGVFTERLDALEIDVIGLKEGR